MSVVKILSAEQIEFIFAIPMAIQAVERAYLEKHSGQSGTCSMVFPEFDPNHADLDIKSGHLGGGNTYGLKVVSSFRANPVKGLPALLGTSLLFDLSTDTPKALLNAGGISRKAEPALFCTTQAFGDDGGWCLSVGECEIPHKKGILTGLLEEIGGVMVGAISGRMAPEDITIFDSAGIALQDLASAASILEAADRANLGTNVEL